MRTGIDHPDAVELAEARAFARDERRSWDRLRHYSRWTILAADAKAEAVRRAELVAAFRSRVERSADLALERAVYRPPSTVYRLDWTHWWAAALVALWIMDVVATRDWSALDRAICLASIVFAAWYLAGECASILRAREAYDRATMRLVVATAAGQRALEQAEARS